MSHPYRKSNTARAVLWALIATVVLAVTGWWVVAPRHQQPGIEQAGSAARVGPVGAFRLVAAMDRLGPDERQIQGYGKDPATISDSRIQVDLVQKLQEMQLPVEPLDIRVVDRRVTLDGRVGEAVVRDAIEVTVRSVEGVREVENRIEVLEP